MRNNFDGEVLRDMRKEAGFTQQDLARRVGISRETVIAIEKNKRGTIDTIELDVLKNWQKLCRNYVSKPTREKVINYIKSYLDLA
ncbi:helix-turn-helix transcriptional regulator [Planctobacterium marinum]